MSSSTQDPISDILVVQGCCGVMKFNSFSRLVLGNDSDLIFLEMADQTASDLRGHRTVITASQYVLDFTHIAFLELERTKGQI